MASNPLMRKIKYFFRFLPDRFYIQLYYFFRFKRFARLKNPRTYNEKLNWLKLYDRKPEYTKMVDKYDVKSYVSSIIGNEFVVPTIGVWDSFSEIDFTNLPNAFVLKCTHDSEGLVIVKNKKEFDVKKARHKLEKALRKNFYYLGREWPYKNVKPRIIAEPYLEDSRFHELRDYKFFCFNGEPKMMFIASGRSENKTKFDFFDMAFRRLDITQHYPNALETSKPLCFDLMKDLAAKLSQGIPHVRIDFYEVDGKVFFGEMTFFHFSGFAPFKPSKWDLILGDMIKLPKKL